jgi:hypothetical protein
MSAKHCSRSWTACNVVNRGPLLENALKVLHEAEARALTAAAFVYRNAVVVKLMAGYTSGAYSHGGAGVVGSVTVGSVRESGDGVSIEVGTNVPYAMFWELGHMNRFTRKYERVEHWRNAMDESGEAMARAFAAIYAKSATTGGPVEAPTFSMGESGYQGPNPAPGFGGYGKITPATTMHRP